MLSDNALFILLVMAYALIIVMGIALWKTRERIKSLSKTQKMFFKGKTGKDLEGVLLEIAKQTENNTTTQQKLYKKVQELIHATNNSYSNIGIIRFNPFQDTGSNQSFVVALLNNEQDGFLLTSLFTRQGTNVYAKPILNAQSEFQLTQEEEQAIHIATSKIQRQ